MIDEIYSVSVSRPDCVTQSEMVEYIRDAVGGWKGGMDPLDLITDMELIKVEKSKTIPSAKNRSRRPVEFVGWDEVTRKFDVSKTGFLLEWITVRQNGPEDSVHAIVEVENRVEVIPYKHVKFV